MKIKISTEAVKVLNDRYVGKYSFKLNKEEDGIAIKVLRPYRDNKTYGLLYLEHVIWPEIDKERRDWPRRWYLKTESGKHINGFDYTGSAIWMVTWNSEPLDPKYISENEFKFLEKKLWETDEEIFKDIPELERLLKTGSI